MRVSPPEILGSGYPGLSRVILEYPGLSGVILGYPGLSWVILGYLGQGYLLVPPPATRGAGSISDGSARTANIN